MSDHLDSLRAAIKLSPDNIPLLEIFAQACAEEFLLQDAQECYQKILAIDKGHLGALLGMAKLSWQGGNISEAVVRVESIVSQHGDCAEAWLLMSRLAIIEGKIDLARDHYKKARQLNPELRDESLEKDFTGKKTSHPDIAPVEQEPIPAENETEDRDGERPQPQSSATKSDFLTDVERPDISFAQVGGMAAVKEDIRMKIIYPLKNAELFKQYGKKAGGGVLLYGPPGCGKTLLSRATAGEVKATFISIGIHQVLDMWLGNSEKNLHSLFQLARKNAPTILFFDEVDALAADRASMKMSAGRNVINQFLAEMDGANGNNEGVLVIGATNAPWQVDSAFRRPGRFDNVIFVPPPDEEARTAIIEILATGKPMQNLDARALAKKTKDFSGADLKGVFDVASEEKLAQAMRENRLIPITTDDLIRAAKKIQPSSNAWFENAKNYAIYANQSGFYNDVLAFLGIKR